jgi:1,4-alpha-glucan branching enzyme
VSERRPQRSFAFFLHGHLPWVIGHGRWPHGLEWLLEAALATYLPLVRLGRRLEARGLRGGITLSVSPILAEQIAHPVFAHEFRAYLEERIRTSQEEAQRFEGRGERKLAALARRWCEHYESSLQFYFDELNEDLPAALRALAASETIELATCGATHGYFPLLARDESIDLQVTLARHTHASHFDAAPHGLWLPEAAYRPAGWWQSPSDGSRVLRPGIEEFLSRRDIHYFLVDASLLAGGKLVETYQDRMKKTRAPARKKEVMHGAPLDTRSSYRAANSEGESSGVSFFVRDPTTATQVWSKDHGYPGDPEYLEFHKKSDGGGHRYWRVTGPQTDLGDKDVYDPDRAMGRARVHAEHFADLVRSALRDAPDGAIVAAPFDAELFGHWWHEGIEWLEQVLHRLHDVPSPSGQFEPTLLREHEHRFPAEHVVKLPEGSWGQGGHHHVWLNPQVEWTWKKIHPAEEEVWSLVERVRRSTNAPARRAATAALRQLLLLCASDWQFLMTTESAAEYAAERVHEHAAHVGRFTALGRKALAGRTIDEEEWVFLQQIEEQDNPFPDLAQVVNLGEPPPAFAASDSRGARSSPREESAGHSPRSQPAIPEESSEDRPGKKKILRRSGSR